MKTTWKGYRMEVPTYWHTFTDAEKARWCNGIGAEGQPEALARLLAKLPDVVDPPSDVHDVEYHIGGTSAERLRADRRWRRNVIAAARQKYGGFWRRMFDPRARLAYIFAVSVAFKGYRLLRIFGGSAFQYSAFPDHKTEAIDQEQP